MAEFNWPNVADAAALIRAEVVFTDALRIREIELLAHKNRRMLDRKPIYDA